MPIHPVLVTLLGEHLKKHQPVARSSQLRGILAGGGRSRIRTWEGEADGLQTSGESVPAWNDIWASRSLGAHWT
jgi:hypothetical protein